MDKKKNAATPKDTPRLNEQPNRNTVFAGTANVRELRVIKFIMAKGSLPRAEVDDVAGCANGPDLISGIRDKGLSTPCSRVPCTDMDGRKTWYGSYVFTASDRAAVAKWMTGDVENQIAQALEAYFKRHRGTRDMFEPEPSINPADYPSPLDAVDEHDGANPVNPANQNPAKPTATEKRAAATSAEDFIVSLLLANGPMQSVEVYFKGDEAGHSKRTIERASGSLTRKKALVKAGSGRAMKWALAANFNTSPANPAKNPAKPKDDDEVTA